MKTKIVKTLKFETDQNTEYQINAVKLQGKTADELLSSVTTDSISPGADVWIFDCGTSTTVI